MTRQNLKAKIVRKPFLTKSAKTGAPKGKEAKTCNSQASEGPNFTPEMMKWQHAHGQTECKPKLPKKYTRKF